MEIKFLGHSAFYVNTSNGDVIIDPFDPDMVGLKWEEQEADLVLCTHDHKDHHYLKGVKGAKKEQKDTSLENFKRPFVIDGPGEYEVGGIHVNGVQAFHDKKKGQDRGPITIFSVRADGFNVVHLGDLGHKLSSDQVESLGEVDVLMIPVGGKYTIGPEAASEVIAELMPKIVVPCHYMEEGVEVEGLEPVKEFLEAMGDEKFKEEKKLSLRGRASLPEETRVVVLQH